MSVVPQKASQEKRKAKREFKGNVSQNNFQDWTGRQYSSPWNGIVCCVSWHSFGGWGQPLWGAMGAALCWAQPAPDTAHSGAALPHSSCLWENLFWEGKKAARAARTEGKMCQKQSCKHWGQRRTRGGDAAAEIPPQLVEESRGTVFISLQPEERTTQKQSSTLQPLGNTTVEQVGIPRRSYGSWRAHAEARERCEKEGAAERNWYGLIPASHSPSPLSATGCGREMGKRQE